MDKISKEKKNVPVVYKFTLFVGINTDEENKDNEWSDLGNSLDVDLGDFLKEYRYKGKRIFFKYSYEEAEPWATEYTARDREADLECDLGEYKTLLEEMRE